MKSVMSRMKLTSLGTGGAGVGAGWSTWCWQLSSLQQSTGSGTQSLTLLLPLFSTRENALPPPGAKSCSSEERALGTSNRLAPGLPPLAAGNHDFQSEADGPGFHELHSLWVGQ